MHRIPQQDLRAASELNAFFIFPPARQGPRRRCSPRTRRWRSGSRALQRLEAQLRARVAARSLRRHGPVRHPARQARAQAARARPAVRDDDRVRQARDRARAARRAGKAAIVFQPLATADFEGIVARHGGGRARHRRATPARRSRRTTTSSATAGWSSPTRTSRTSWSASTRSPRAPGRRLRRAASCAPCSRSATSAAAASTGSTTTSAARSTRSSRPAAAQQRDNERELRLKAQIGAELPVEAELERWFPLWGIPI